MQQHANTYSVLTHTLDPWGGIKGKNSFFLDVMLYIKLKHMEHRAPCKYIFCPYTNPQPQIGVKKVKTFFSESSHVTYQIKGNGAKRTMQAHLLSFYTSCTPGVVWSKGQKYFTKTSHVAYQIKGNGT